MKTKLLSIFALLLMAATGAWAQTPTLLTTIEGKENTDFTSGSKTFGNIATVTFSGEVVNDGKYGWYTPLALDIRSILLTVTAVEGYTITSCKFYYDVLYFKYSEDFEAPFQATLSHDGKKHLIEVNGNSFIGRVTKIEVYGYPTPSVTLVDGEAPSALSSYTGKTVDVTYKRPFTAGKASTVCLPFEYVKKSGEKFYAFTSVSKDGDDYVAEMTEDEAATLTANTPYLFMPSTTGDVDFSGTYVIPAAIEAGETTSGDWTFTGTYETKKWEEEAPTGIYGFSAQDTEDGISQGQFVKVGKYVFIKPMRAYLMYKGGAENYATVRMKAPARGANEEMLPETISVRLIDADGEVSAIGTLNTVTGKVSLDGWYTLSGKRLMGQPTQKGIYVNNGKKVIIK